MFPDIAASLIMVMYLSRCGIGRTHADNGDFFNMVGLSHAEDCTEWFEM